MDQHQRRGSRAGRIIADAQQELERPGDVLVAERISYRYVNGPEVLRDVSLQVSRRDNISIYGKPEVGKTTLARVLAAELPPSDGRLHVDGRRIGGEVTRVAFPPTEWWPGEWTAEEYLGDCFSLFRSSFVARRLARDTLAAAELDDYRSIPRDALCHRVRAEVTALGAFIDLPCWLVLDEPDFKLAGHDEIRSLMRFVAQCAELCRTGLIWLTSSILSELHADRSLTLHANALWAP
ncbi:MAG: ATP-binding cassette domain-containing protein [Actinobacteria bacterium ATB1]|nr:ATP-binding cassette domain-containing protein [Actinobacteria bacterium ATB1]